MKKKISNVILFPVEAIVLIGMCAYYGTHGVPPMLWVGLGLSILGWISFGLSHYFYLEMSELAQQLGDWYTIYKQIEKSR